MLVFAVSLGQMKNSFPQHIHSGEAEIEYCGMESSRVVVDDRFGMSVEETEGIRGKARLRTKERSRA